MEKISVVVPCFNEEEAIPVYYQEMCRVMKKMPDVRFEMIFVDDGSSDQTLKILKELKRSTTSPQKYLCPLYSSSTKCTVAFSQYFL